MRRTRILATIGPASNQEPTIAALLGAGVDAFRLNFSHGTRESHAATCRLIREVAARSGRDVAVLQDLGGPKIRIGPIASPMSVAPGDRLVIQRGHAPGGDGRVSCEFDALFTSVSPKSRLLIDDGRIELEAIEVHRDEIVSRVLSGGSLLAGKGINIPGAPVKTAAMTEKDRADLSAGIAMGVDLVAVSFVQTPGDVVEVRKAADAFGASTLPIVAKIEKPQAVDAIEGILDVADGLMVARGDLGVEVPLETVPTVQAKIVRAARRRGVPVILATQVLESMRTEPRPTRAEVTDAAHAVGERVDTIMLSGETAMGLHPVRAVAVLDAVIREAERATAGLATSVPEGAMWSAHGRALCEAAVALAESAGARAIVAVTRAGKTARLLAAMRPDASIIAVTPQRHVAAQLTLVWGVSPVVTEHRAIGRVREELTERRLIDAGDVVVFVSVHATLGHEHINFVHVERI